MAVDTDAVLQRLEAALKESNAKVLGGEVTSEGNNILVKNFGVEFPSFESPKNLTLRLNNITENEDGSFTVEKLSVDETSLVIDGSQFDIGGIEIEQVYLPVEETPSYTLAYQPYKSISVNNFSIYHGEKPILKAGKSYMSLSDFETGKRIKQHGFIEDISIDMSDMGEDTSVAVKALGYETVDAKVEFTAGIDFSSGIFDLEKFNFHLDDIGTLSMRMQFGGYTLETAKAFSDFSAQQVGDSQAMGLAALGLAQKLTLNKISVRFDDNSITNKLLDLFAAGMQSSRQDIITTASSITQLSLISLQYPDFTLKVSQAVDSYLNAPQSFEVVAAPNQPLPFMMIFGAAQNAMQNPKGLIDMLAVEVSANK